MAASPWNEHAFRSEPVNGFGKAVLQKAAGSG
jgi:hypothetical protein